MWCWQGQQLQRSKSQKRMISHSQAESSQQQDKHLRGEDPAGPCGGGMRPWFRCMASTAFLRASCSTRPIRQALNRWAACRLHAQLRHSSERVHCGGRASRRSAEFVIWLGPGTSSAAWM